MAKPGSSSIARAVERARLRHSLARTLGEGFARAQPRLVGLHIAGAAAAQPPLLARGERNRQRADNLLDHFVLRRKDIGAIAIEPLRPEMPPAAAIDKLRGDAHPVARLADAAFEHEAHPEIAPDLLHLDRPAF